MSGDDHAEKDKPTPDSSPAPDLPAGNTLPEPPDLAKVRELRNRMHRDRAESGIADRRSSRLSDPELGRRARDIGMYTIIPMMMVVGPAVGYLMGVFLERRFGGEPWLGVVGVLLGLVAAFRQIYLLLMRKTDTTRTRR